MKQLLTFFGLAYLISWTIWLPLYGHKFGLTNLPSVPYQHAIGGLGPFIASFLTTWIFLKKEGINHILQGCVRMKPLMYLAIAFFSPFIIALLAMSISYFADNLPLDIMSFLNPKDFPEFTFPIFLIYNLIFFGFGEEVGWRGFALPRLQNRFSALTASVILTIFWALWHLPLFLYRPGYATMDIAGIVGWFFSLLTGSILLTWLYNSSRGSILICAVFHSTIDIAFTADIAGENVVGYMGFLITVWGLLIIPFFKPKNLAIHPRIKYPPTPVS